MNKATEDQFNELHNLVTSEFLKRVKGGEASTQDLKAACDWLKTNDISGVAYDGSPLEKLAKVRKQMRSRRQLNTRQLLRIQRNALKTTRCVRS